MTITIDGDRVELDTLTDEELLAHRGVLVAHLQDRSQRALTPWVEQYPYDLDLIDDELASRGLLDDLSA